MISTKIARGLIGILACSFLTFQATREIKASNIRNRADVRKAMTEYRQAHPRCEWDNCSDQIEVHHIKPISVYPELASDTNNMISLGAKRCHLVVGHGNNYGKYYIENIREICRLRIIAECTNAP
jgi:hypothetical protein